MFDIEIRSRLRPEEVIRRAVKFFGLMGYGLRVKEEASCCVEFEGGGGWVIISASAQENGTKVELESREWDYQVKEFIQKIK